VIEHLPGDFPLSGTPGFHSLERVVFDGVLERGGIVLKLFCVCNKVDAVARIETRPTKAPDKFMYWQVTRTELQLSPALDARTERGHFVTEDPWTVRVEGMPPGLAPKLAKYRRPRARPQVVAPSEVRPAAPPTNAMLQALRECPNKICPHDLGYHDERFCSKCGGPCKPKKASRARKA
jgi:hypothetical protein